MENLDSFDFGSWGGLIDEHDKEINRTNVVTVRQFGIMILLALVDCVSHLWFCIDNISQFGVFAKYSKNEKFRVLKKITL
ncbi:MAG: hypothetical protein IPJ71_09480 [Bdellovibrionales bacterium]|nr:hypothetical protein [Bdellovibrionales bacterium]